MKPRASVALIGSRGIPDGRGGVERVLEAIAPRLVDRGVPTTAYCSWSRQRPRFWRGVRLAYVPSVPSKHFDTFIRSALAILRECIGGSKIIHIHASGSAPLAVIPRLFGCKVVVTVHGADWQRRKWGRAGRWFLRFGECPVEAADLGGRDELVVFAVHDEDRLAGCGERRVVVAVHGRCHQQHERYAGIAGAGRCGDPRSERHARCQHRQAREALFCKRNGGGEVFLLAWTRVEGAAAHPDAPKVEAQRRDPGPGEALGGLVERLGMHRPAVERVRMAAHRDGANGP